LTLHQTEGAPFAGVTTADERKELEGVDLFPLLMEGACEIFRVVWSPNHPREACQHGSHEEIAIVLAGTLVDEDGRTYGPWDCWRRPAEDVHHPRSGPEGAEVLIIRRGGA
jgi:hypothetical protein